MNPVLNLVWALEPLQQSREAGAKIFDPVPWLSRGIRS